MNGASYTRLSCISAAASTPHQRQCLLGALCHNDVRAVKDSAIVLRADRVETLDAEPIALGPEKYKNE